MYGSSGEPCNDETYSELCTCCVNHLRNTKLGEKVSSKTYSDLCTGCMNHFGSTALREKVSTIGTVCRCRHSFCGQKYVVLYVRYYTWAADSPAFILRLLPHRSQWEYDKVCVYCTVYNLIRSKMTTMPVVLKDIWSMNCTDVWTSEESSVKPFSSPVLMFGSSVNPVLLWGASLAHSNGVENLLGHCACWVESPVHGGLSHFRFRLDILLVGISFEHCTGWGGTL